MRNDNGSGAVNWNVYQVAAVLVSACLPRQISLQRCRRRRRTIGTVSTRRSSGSFRCRSTLYTRQGPKLSLQPLGSPAFDQSVIPFDHGYFSDIWRWKSCASRSPTVSITRSKCLLMNGTGNRWRWWINGSLNVADYLLRGRRRPWQAGYNPSLGFATVSNVAAGRSTPIIRFTAASVRGRQSPGCWTDMVAADTAGLMEG